MKQQRLKRTVSAIVRARRRIGEMWTQKIYSLRSINGHRDFIPFIVLTRSRTGSNLLVSFLNSHPQIRSEGEIFARIGGRPVEPILARVFGKQPRIIKAKGFKLFYYHPLDATQEMSTRLWRALEKNTAIRVIHLVRKNKLRTITSRRIAERQDVWTGTGHDLLRDISEKQVEMSPDEVEQEFLKMEEWEISGERRFDGHPIIQIAYEELTEHPTESFRRIADFLGLSYSKPRSSLNKQNPERLSDLIVNYDDLRKAFENTRWSAFFDD